MRVFFRVDESSKIGRGHMSRCCSLAKSLLNAGVEVFFFCKEVRPETKTTLADLSIKIILLEDENLFFEQDMSNVVVVVDGYQFNIDFWQKLISSGPHLTVCIDDFRGVAYLADIVICYNEGLKADQFDLLPHTRLFLGGRYLLLRPEILGVTELYDTPTTRRALMVAVGGTRQELWVADMLFYLSRIEPRLPLWVLSGARLSENKVLYRSGLSRSRVRFFSNIGVNSMIRRYRQAHCLLVPASTMMLEAFSVGTPIISGSIAINQRNSLNFYESQGFISNAGNLKEASFSTIALAYTEAIRKSGKMVRRQRAYIEDSRLGVSEIIQAIISKS